MEDSVFKQVLLDHTEQDRTNFERIDSSLNRLDTKVESVQNDVSEIKASLRHQKGFIAGVVAVITAVAGAFALAVSWLKG